MFFVRPIISGMSGKGGPTRSLSSRRLLPERDLGLQERDGRCAFGTGQRPKPRMGGDNDDLYFGHKLNQ
jgi:hypothetical protein